MKTFVVNLDRDADKLQQVAKRLAEVGVAFERFSAVLGKSLTKDERAKSINSFRVWCSIGRRLEDGELGCTLSHLNIYRKMVDEGVAVACVLEDDVVIDERIAEQLTRVEHYLQTETPRVVLLSDRGHANIQEWSVCAARGDWGTFAYMLNAAAARAILKVNYPIQRPCDHWARWVSAGVIELYHAYPTVCDYDHSQESQTATRRKVADYSLPHWLCHKFLRLIGRTFDRILPL